jgi:hypothetical protein
MGSGDCLGNGEQGIGDNDQVLYFRLNETAVEFASAVLFV